MRALKKVDSRSREVNKVQQNVEEALNPVLASQIIDGVLLKNISLVSGSVNQVEHKLNRNIQGWIIVRRRANSDVWDSQDTNSFPKLTLSLNASANVIVDLWIF